MGGSGLAWPRLVFVEGLPGSGKSTTAQWIAHEIETGGAPIPVDL
jgi:thymidylate kinase